MISDIAKNVFCPEEQPKSATLMYLGKFKFIISSFVFLTKTGLVFDNTPLWKKYIKKTVN